MKIYIVDCCLYGLPETIRAQRFFFSFGFSSSSINPFSEPAVLHVTDFADFADLVDLIDFADFVDFVDRVDFVLP